MNGYVFLKFVAIILIVNSHCDFYYPISSFATGGAIGNSVFFMLSSFGLYLSEANKPRQFLEWYSRRIARIFPSTWVVLILLYFPIELINKRLFEKDFLSLCGYFFYPPYWFIQALMIMYLFIFLLIKNYSEKKLLLYSAVTLTLYLITYFRFLDTSVFSIEEIPIKLFFYFGMCLFGIWIAKTNDKVRYEGPKDYIGFTVCVFIMYFHKFLMSKHLFMDFQILQHIVLFPMMLFAFKFSRSESVSVKIFQMPKISKFIRWVAEHTLEIYTVHMTISPFILKARLKFPLNFVIFVLAIMVFVPIVSDLSKKIFVKNRFI